ncbi:serine/threonine-protein kinase [Microbacterium album]|uniref:non-specific serine/threonine protein kinase n=1 Tax=Microbacterium album TaxID=2053191 RepID=A0A917MN92_9MICO|nr:serine/threonine-protein kinase [Microbacterium album]GGH50906.1 serine/threonine protein kinase [Microbacterium album]
MNQRRPPAPPPALPGLTPLELLGSGGFADVYLYEQELPRRRVAVKVLLPDRISGSAEQFSAEANVMAMLSTHPAIVTIYQAGVASDGRPYLVMEYCPRPNLQVRYRREPFSVAEALRVGIPVAAAVETAHRAGVLHRDIKPANILVTEYNRPALTDFGIASTSHGAGGSTGMSIPWSPPEAFAEVPQSGPRTDVYQLGATVYTLLAGRSPFELPGERNGSAELIERIERMPLPAIDRPDIPESLQAVLRRAMAKDPAERYPSAVTFARALQKVQIELAHSVTPVDILDDRPLDDLPEDDDGGLTRVRSVTNIAPGDTATRPSATTEEVPGARAGEIAAHRAFAPSAPRPSDGRPGQIDDVTILRDPRPADPIDDATILRPPASAAAPAARPAPAEPWSAPVPDAAPAAPEPRAAGDGGAAVAERRRRWPWLVAAGVVVAGAVAVAALSAPGLLEPEPAPSEPPVVAPQDPRGDPVPRVTDGTGVVQGDQVVFTWGNPDPQPGDYYLWQRNRIDGAEAVETTEETSVTIPADAERVCIDVTLVRQNGRYTDQPVTICAPD